MFFAPVSIAYSTQLVSQAASLNIGIPFLGSDTWDDNMVLKAAGSTDPAKVMEALPGVTYDGVSGHIAFDETGDAIRDTAYIKTIDTAANVWKFVTQQKAS